MRPTDPVTRSRADAAMCRRGSLRERLFIVGNREEHAVKRATDPVTRSLCFSNSLPVELAQFHLAVAGLGAL